jgi:hypothetical protein
VKNNTEEQAAIIETFIKSEIAYKHLISHDELQLKVQSFIESNNFKNLQFDIVADMVMRKEIKKLVVTPETYNKNTIKIFYYQKDHKINV